MLTVAAIQLAIADDTFVVLDSWWNRDVARSQCDQAKKFMREHHSEVQQGECPVIIGCADNIVAYNACLKDDLGGVVGFEEKLLKQIAASQVCKGIRAVNFKGPQAPNENSIDVYREPHWTLSLDYKPGQEREQWTLQDSKGAISGQGDDHPADLAENVCTILKSHAMKLR
jgi:hypothetical protein